MSDIPPGNLKRRIIPFTSNSLVQARQAGGFYAGQVARAMAGAAGVEASMPGRFAETVGLVSNKKIPGSAADWQECN